MFYSGCQYFCAIQAPAACHMRKLLQAYSGLDVLCIFSQMFNAPPGYASSKASSNCPWIIGDHRCRGEAVAFVPMAFVLRRPATASPLRWASRYNDLFTCRVVGHLWVPRCRGEAVATDTHRDTQFACKCFAPTMGIVFHSVHGQPWPHRQLLRRLPPAIRPTASCYSPARRFHTLVQRCTRSRRKPVRAARGALSRSITAPAQA